MVYGESHSDMPLVIIREMRLLREDMLKTKPSDHKTLLNLTPNLNAACQWKNKIAYIIKTFFAAVLKLNSIKKAVEIGPEYQ